MPIITSISGIRGTIGGTTNSNLTPINTVKYAAAFGQWLKKNTQNKPKIIIGRDARISGEMIDMIICGTIIGLGIDIINIGLATTPTTEMAIINEKANGGIIITASHNPENWNALKLLNEKGEFLNKKAIEEIFEILQKTENTKFSTVNNLGKITHNNNNLKHHIDKIKKLPLVDIQAIKKSNFKIIIDTINSVGAIALPKLLKELGVNEIIELNNTPNGKFAHNPEPLPENLTEISEKIIQTNANIGFVVDPDVDRLAIVMENGKMFGEEYSLVAIANYILKHKKGNTVSNLSSTRALKDITEKHGGKYFTAPVGEINVIEKMKETNAIIGGEGNGGIIYPELHYGRDALVGIALFLSYIAKEKITPSELRKQLPEYHIVKQKQETKNVNIDKTLEKITKKYSKYKPTTIDGVKIDLEKSWVHLRKSNTEPIIRIYAEAKTKKEATELIQEIKKLL